MLIPGSSGAVIDFTPNRRVLAELFNIFVFENRIQGYCLHNFTPPAFARSKFEFAPPKLLKVAESQATTTMHRWNGECDFIAAPFVSVSKGKTYILTHKMK